MIEAHLLKLRRRDEISAEEEEAIRGAIVGVRDYRADEVAIRAHVELTTSTLLLEGWMARTKDLKNGQRQVTELHVPGDFADLHSLTLKRLEHDVIALTPCKVAIASHAHLREITERFPHLTRVYWFSTNLDAAIQREWTVSLGARSALERMAHLFCELRIRLDIIGMVQDNSFEFPLTQADIAECVGITGVHVNRMLQDLRRRRLIHVEGRRATIRDTKGLEQLADFDDSYLYLERKDR